MSGAGLSTLHLNVRDAQGVARQIGDDASGKAVCDYFAAGCAVTGSSRYQVLVEVPEGKTAPATYRLDALRVGTPAGPAPECVEVPNVSYGFGPLVGTLSGGRHLVAGADLVRVPVVRQRAGDLRGHQDLVHADERAARDADHREGDGPPDRSHGRGRVDPGDGGGRGLTHRPPRALPSRKPPGRRSSVAPGTSHLTHRQFQWMV